MKEIAFKYKEKKKKSWMMKLSDMHSCHCDIFQLRDSTAKGYAEPHQKLWLKKEHE